MTMRYILKTLALGIWGFGLIAAPVTAVAEAEARGAVEECVLTRTAIRQPAVAARTVSPPPIAMPPAVAGRRLMDQRPAIAIQVCAPSRSPRSPPLL